MATMIQAPIRHGKKTSLVRDLAFFSLLALAGAIPASTWLSSVIPRTERGASFQFRYDQQLSSAVRLDSLRVRPLGTGRIQIRLDYSQLIRDANLPATTLCLHMVPDDKANVEKRHRSRGYNNYDFKPATALGSWDSTYTEERLLAFPGLDNQRATIRVGTWNDATQKATTLYSYPFDFAEFQRGADGIYAAHLAPASRWALVIYLATALVFLAVITFFSRRRSES